MKYQFHFSLSAQEREPTIPDIRKHYTDIYLYLPVHTDLGVKGTITFCTVPDHMTTLLSLTNQQ